MAFAAYLSHSWRPRDVDLNLLVWNEIKNTCEMLVDVPEEAGPDPPYYVNRIEELLRRSDLFVCVLTYRPASNAQPDCPDAAVQCSPYAIFEIRLAERFDRPRLVLYERRTGFKSPRSLRPNEIYIAFDRAAAEPLPDLRNWRGTIAPKIRQWVEWVTEHYKPVSYEPSSLAVSLLPPDGPDAAAAAKQVKSQLRQAQYERVSRHAVFSSNSEAFQLLHSAGLVIVDLAPGHPVASALYAAAHALGVPAIRMMRGWDGRAAALPWLLQGHPGGYQNDVIAWNQPEDLAGKIEPRARAMFRTTRALGPDEAERYLVSKRYSHCYVFLSHTLKPPDRGLVELIYELLGKRYVTPFEYHIVNAAGDDWKKALDQHLGRTTHFIALLSDDYEQSPVCTYEMEEILKRGDEVKILPFMVGGRSKPHPKLGHLHNRLLDGADRQADAELVVTQVMAAVTPA